MDTIPKTTACWRISLDCDCPHCKEYVDLTDNSDFWHDQDMQVGEHNTMRSRNVKVYCPECYGEFLIDTEY